MILVTALIIAILYSFLILRLALGWKRLSSKPKLAGREEKLTVTIIIPARNESGKIGMLLQDIAAQTYPGPWMEVIVIDDASEDDTAQEARNALSKTTLQGQVLTIPEIPNNPSPKKRALTEGIRVASGSLILTTDADCRVKTTWVKSMVDHHLSSGAVFVSGPVRQAPLTTTFSKVQALEFLSLVGSGAGAIGAGKALMSNGANLAFSKEAFKKVSGYAGNDHYASGDDVFLMMKMKKTFGKTALSFAKRADAIVDTEAKKTWQEFFHQRTRWASKTKAYQSGFALYSSVLVFAFNALLLVLIPVCLLLPQHQNMVIVLWTIKILTDVFMLAPLVFFMKQKELLWYYLPSELFVAFYTSTVALIGFTRKFSWKGRVYKN